MLQLCHPQPHQHHQRRGELNKETKFRFQHRQNILLLSSLSSSFNFSISFWNGLVICFIFSTFLSTSCTTIRSGNNFLVGVSSFVPTPQLLVRSRLHHYQHYNHHFNLESSTSLSSVRYHKQNRHRHSIQTSLHGGYDSSARRMVQQSQDEEVLVGTAETTSTATTNTIDDATPQRTVTIQTPSSTSSSSDSTSTRTIKINKTNANISHESEKIDSKLKWRRLLIHWKYVQYIV